MSETRVRETAAPWFRRQADFDGVSIALIDHQMAAHEYDHPPYGDTGYSVDYASGPMRDCFYCDRPHICVNGATVVHKGDSLDEANAAFDELERKLLAGELHG